MSKPIYADDLLNRIEYSEKWNNAKCPEWVKGIINSMPKAQLSGEGTTLESKEQKTAKWTICAKADKSNRMIDEYELVCSRCGYTVENVRSYKDIPRLRFCGRCGAKMGVWDDK